MANSEHLKKLMQGVEAWNLWRSSTSIQPDLTQADLSEMSLSGADLSNTNLAAANLRKAWLSEANLQGAILTGANITQTRLRSANLTGANLVEASLIHADIGEACLRESNLSMTDLSYADLSGADLTEANLKNAWLMEAKLRDTTFVKADLTEANLMIADLRGANFNQSNLVSTVFEYADLNTADLSNADLSKAILHGTQALYADFTGARLTGACIKDWNINNQTKFNQVDCQYIYFECTCFSMSVKSPIELGYYERRPYKGKFKDGEFTLLLNRAFETVDLVFTDGIDWKAFLTSFQELQATYKDSNLSIQAIEKKSDEAFVIRLEASSDLDKAIIESQVKTLYEQKLKILETQYRTQLEAKDTEITIYRQQSTDLMEIVKLQASRNINVEAKTVVEQSKSVEVEMNFHAPVAGATGKNQGVININSSEQRQTLAEAAAEIQRLLKQLEETNPAATEPEQVNYVSVAAKPDLKQRAIAALKAGGDTAIDEFFLENKYLKVGKAVVKAWLQPGS